MSKRFIPKEEWEALYKHPLWQKKRLEILDYAEWQCQGCGAKDKQLHVHHARYVRGKKPWQYPNGWLTSMRWECHEKLHGKKEQPAEAPAMESAPTGLLALWTGVVAMVRLERKLISAWVEAGELRSVEDGIATINFPSNQAYAAEFLEQNHMEFLRRCFHSISGRRFSVLIQVDGTTKVAASFGAMLERLGKL